MQAGKLDRRITIRRATVVQDPGSGQNIETWADLATVAASWRRASSREILAAAEISAAISDVFRIRWSSATASVTPLDRLTYAGREYNIESVAEIGRRDGVELMGNARAE